MTAEIDERPTDDVWILSDTGSIVCEGLSSPRSKRNLALTMTIVDRDVKLRWRTQRLWEAPETCLWKSRIRISVSKFRVANVAKPIVSAEGLFQAECTTVTTKTGGCDVITPSGQTRRIGDGERAACKGESAQVENWKCWPWPQRRWNPEVQGLPAVAQDPGDEQALEAASSFNRPVLPVPEPRPELQENRGDRELLRETDGDTLEVSTEAAAAKARGIPVLPPLAERQRHRLVHLPFRNWCIFCVIGRGREESDRRRLKKDIMTPRVWLD